MLMQTLHFLKTTSSPTRHAKVRAVPTAIALAVSTALLVACGGGSTDTVASVPTTQMALGAITGFGSVDVDGVVFDDSAAETAVEDAQGQRVATKLELGQRVRVLHDGQGKATRLIVEAAVVGSVTAVDAAAGTLTVAAQLVRINTDPAAGPVTRFGGGYGTLADVLGADDVEIHGSPVYDASAQRYEIRATRVAKLDSRSHYRVGGAAAAVDADSFELNGLTVSYTADAVKPAGATLTDGAGVVVFGTQMVGTTLTATAVRVLRAEVDAPVARTQVALGGFVSTSDAATGQFVVDGQTVRLGSVVPTPAGAAVQAGAYVKVAGTMAADGVVDASRVGVRTAAADDALATIRLAGEITDLVDGPAFLVRGVPVDASGATPAANCPSPLVDGTLVQVRAQAQAGSDVVAAFQIDCPTPGSLRPREVLGQGLLWPVDAKTQSFGLTDARTGQSIKVRWDDKTVFLGLPRPGSAELEAQVLRTVRVEGYQQGDEVLARVVRDVSAPAGRRDGDRFRRAPDQQGKPQPWVAYQQLK
jgi:hypothetical protein